MTKYDFDPNDGTVYEYPSIEDELARSKARFSRKPTAKRSAAKQRGVLAAG